MSHEPPAAFPPHVDDGAADLQSPAARSLVQPGVETVRDLAMSDERLLTDEQADYLAHREHAMERLLLDRTARIEREQNLRDAIVKGDVEHTKARAEVLALREMLRSVQWEGDFIPEGDPSGLAVGWLCVDGCGNTTGMGGHAPDCALAALLEPPDTTGGVDADRR